MATKHITIIWPYNDITASNTQLQFYCLLLLLVLTHGCTTVKIIYKSPTEALFLLAPFHFSEDPFLRLFAAHCRNVLKLLPLIHYTVLWFSWRGKISRATLDWDATHKTAMQKWWFCHIYLLQQNLNRVIAIAVKHEYSLWLTVLSCWRPRAVAENK